MTGKQSPLTSRVLLCLSLEAQEINYIDDRVLKTGKPIDRDTLKGILKKLVRQKLAHREQRGHALYFRLAVGPAVDLALDEAWAAMEASA
ncbi:hypothetical protein [Deinococcus sp. QL22]|uniref:hypothetical protein n=1 Tax=Deinococcus sp. QL22 TaxID=2939437 RepID=UPI002016AAA8|nr:hypothetical protein [Deinococcus sp. QL22]UQN10244.1 hypothetical protein M1R55_28115 [Deinococcus sp. QL22]